MNHLRGRRLLAFTVLLVALAIALPRFLTYTPYQRLGVRLDWNDPVGIAKVIEVRGPPGRGLLEKGDLVLEVEGKVLTQDDLKKRLVLKQGAWPRGPIQLVIERDGRRRSVVVPPLNLTAWQRIRVFTLPMAAVVAAPLVAFLLVWRRPDLSASWVFLWFALLQGLNTVFELFRFPQIGVGGLFGAYMTGYDAMCYWLPASFLHFMSVFPRPRWGGRNRRTSPWFWLVVLAYLTPPVLFAVSHGINKQTETLYVVFQAIALPLGVMSLLDRYARPARPGWNPKMRERVIAMVVGVTLLAASVFTAVSEDASVQAMFSLPVVRLLFTSIWLAWLCSPLLIALLIANDPVFDPRRLIVQSLPYALLSGVLAAMYLGIVLVSQRLFAVATGEDALVFNVVAALIVAFAFAPLRERLQRGLDQLYGRDPIALRRALDQAGRDLLGALDPAGLRASVEGSLARGLKRQIAVEWPEGGAPRIAEGESVPEHARAAVDNLLLQAGIRLENLALQDSRAVAERRAVELREAATRAELRALHAQVQPHFLFNALNALSYLIETDPPAAQRFTERLADMLRYTVEAGRRPAALLSEELGFVEDYLGVARERYENPLEFEYLGSPDLLSAAVPPLLLQPLVENSLKHGCAPGERALHLSLTARHEDGWLTLEFSDDGATNGNGGPGLGVGLRNLEQRVRRFAGAGAVMEAGPREDGGFRVLLRWPSKNGVAIGVANGNGAGV